jgi:hypothetical protein
LTVKCAQKGQFEPKSDSEFSACTGVSTSTLLANRAFDAASLFKPEIPQEKRLSVFAYYQRRACTDLRFTLIAPIKI